MCYYDLLETFASKPGCPICVLLQRDAHRFMDSLLYEYVTDYDINMAFRAGRGLCNEHGWQITEFIGTKLGLTILYEATLDEILKIMDKNPVQGGFWRGSGLAEKLEPAGECVVCKDMNRAEGAYVLAISEGLTDAKLKAAYENSAGVCLPHFRQVLKITREPEKQKIAVAIQQTIWKRLKVELNEYMEKNNATSATEMGTERDSWLRAVQQLAGERGIFGMRRD